MEVSRTFAGIAALLQLGCVPMTLFGSRVTVREMAGAGRMETPAALELTMKKETADTLIYSFSHVIDSFLWMGSNMPVRAVLAVAISSTGADAAGLRNRAASEAGERCRNRGLESPMPGQVSVSACSYEVNLHVEPSWLLTAADPARRVAMAYRVFQKDSSPEAAAKVLSAALASYRPAADPPVAFREIQDRPLRDVEAAALREARMLAWFERQGWPAPRLEETVRRHDCAYFWSRQFRSWLGIACLAGSRPRLRDQPPWTGELYRLHGVTVGQYMRFNDQWRLLLPGQGTDLSAAPWSAFQAETFDPNRVYYFLSAGQYLLYEGVADDANPEPAFLDAFLEAKAKAVMPKD